MTRTSFSNAAFAQLVRRLRHTNARYDRIAHQIRCRIRHTYHAKRHAYRAGLRIDTSKARACPGRYISTKPLPVLDRSTACSPVVGGSTLSTSTRIEANATRDAYMRGLRPPSLRYLPEVVSRRRRRHRGSGGRQRIMLCLPPFKLHLNVDYQCYGAAEAPSQFQGPVPVPGAPRLTPRQLPEDECGAEVFESAAMDEVKSDSSMAPIGLPVYSGLCITTPTRNLKRKLQDIEAEEGAALSHQPKRLLKTRLGKRRHQ